MNIYQVIYHEPGQKLNFKKTFESEDSYEQFLANLQEGTEIVMTNAYPKDEYLLCSECGWVKARTLGFSVEFTDGKVSDFCSTECARKHTMFMYE